MFWLVPSKGTQPGPAKGIVFPGPNSLNAGYTLRQVQGFNELIEKVLLLDTGIDNPLMELFKLHVQRQDTWRPTRGERPLVFTESTRTLRASLASKRHFSHEAATLNSGKTNRRHDLRRPNFKHGRAVDGNRRIHASIPLTPAPSHHRHASGNSKLSSQR